MHGADGDMAAYRFDVFVENLEGQTTLLDCGLGAVQLRFGSDEHTKLMRQSAGLRPLRNPVADSLDFLAFVPERQNCGRRAIEHGNRVAAILGIAVHVSHHGTEQSIGLCADLVGGAVIDPQSSRSPPNVDAQALPGKWLLKDALSQVAGEKETIGATATQGSKKSEMSNTDILRFVHDYEVEYNLLVFGDGRGQCGEQLCMCDQVAILQRGTNVLEDEPQHCALRLRQPGLPAEPHYIAVLLPGRQPPCIHDLFPFREQENAR